MSYKSTLKINSKLFDKRERAAAGGRAAYKSAKVFKKATVQRMVKSVPRGRIDTYENLPNNRGRGFQRRFRRSARGQRPAIETTTLINAVSDKKLNETSAEVFIADRKNPRNGASARVYAEILQTKLDRPIMNKDDKRIAEIEFKFRVQKEIEKLL